MIEERAWLDGVGFRFWQPGFLGPQVQVSKETLGAIAPQSPDQNMLR